VGVTSGSTTTGIGKNFNQIDYIFANHREVDKYSIQVRKGWMLMLLLSQMGALMGLDGNDLPWALRVQLGDRETFIKKDRRGTVKKS